MTNISKALQRELDGIAQVAEYLWQKGWAERNGGNITVNLTHLIDDGFCEGQPVSQPIDLGQELDGIKGHYFYAKGTGRRMRDLARNAMQNGSIIRICDDGMHYQIIGDPIEPTSELPAHLALQNMFALTGSANRAIVHTHPIELIAMSHLQEFLDEKHLTETLWSMIPETVLFAPKGIGVVHFHQPGSLEMAVDTLETMKCFDVVLWEKHGVCAAGENVIEAFDQIDVLNKAAQIYQSACTMGQKPQGIVLEEVEKMRNMH